MLGKALLFCAGWELLGLLLTAGIWTVDNLNYFAEVKPIICLRKQESFFPGGVLSTNQSAPRGSRREARLLRSPYHG
jgi:hypothetical protein